MDKLRNNIERSNKFILWALLISMVFHVLLLSVKTFKETYSQASAAPAEEQKKIRVVFKRDKKPRQIVESEQTENNVKTEDSKFLGKKTQTFLRETTAQKVGSFKSAGKGVRTGKENAKSTMQRVAPPVAKMAKQAKPAKQTKRKVVQKKKKAVSFADLAAPKAPKNLEKVKQAQKQQRQLSSLAALGLKNGKASKTGLSANNDYVEDIPLGDMTKLNTVEYKYYGFYHRIKQKLEQYWGNNIQKKAHMLWKSGRRVPASENRITSLEVTLDNRGNIVHVNVKGSSGIRELDEAAIESFNKAGPFPNPPKGMVKNGLARIEWGFVVKS